MAPDWERWWWCRWLEASNSEEASLAQVLSISGSRVTEGGSLSTPTHDACASEVGGVVYLFGGGEQSSFSTILRVSTAGTAVQVGSLPTPASDVACVTVGGTVYVIGGNTGTTTAANDRGLAAGPFTPRRRGAAQAVAVRGGRGGRWAAPDRRWDERGAGEPGTSAHSFDPEDGTVNSIGHSPTA